MTRSNAARAIITGDLTLSEQLPAAVRRAVPQRLNAGLTALREDGVDVSDVDVFRGDAWQVVVRDASASLRVATTIRAELLAWRPDLDTRAVIGIGRIESEGEDRVSSGYGEAFTLSGRGLDALPKDRRLAIRVAEDLLDVGAVLDAGLYLLDRIIIGWTAAQARAIAGSLRGLAQDDIGAQWPDGPISQQAVAQHLQRASWNAVEYWIDTFQSYLSESMRG